MRIDQALFFLRFAKSRSIAQRWVAEGHMRRNGQRVVRLDQPISPGDVLTLPIGRRVAIIEILTLPSRRGPSAEAQACYRALDAGGANAIAGAPSAYSEGTEPA